MAQLTLWGMYQYDPTLFDDIALPEGYSKTNLVNTIMRKSGMLYPYHQVPPQLKINITTWFEVRRYDFEQMYKAFHAEYSPIENYDRHEDITRNHKDSGSDSVSGSGTGKAINTPEITVTQSNRVAAFDSPDTQPRSQMTQDTVGSNTTESQNSSEATTTYGKVQDEKELAHIHGNIGVTTNQQMITAELEMRIQYDLYNTIARLFEHEFLIQVY